MLLSTGRVPAQMHEPLRAVFDTNVVVSALLFPRGSVAWLRETWAGVTIVPVVSREIVQELIRVLAYPKFRLTSYDREELLGDYIPYTELAEIPEVNEKPRCRDPHDQIFVDAAVTARVHVLVSGVGHLQELGPSLEMPVWSPGTLREEWELRFRR